MPLQSHIHCFLTRNVDDCRVLHAVVISITRTVQVALIASRPSLRRSVNKDDKSESQNSVHVHVTVCTLKVQAIDERSARRDYAPGRGRLTDGMALATDASSRARPLLIGRWSLN